MAVKKLCVTWAYALLMLVLGGAFFSRLWGIAYGLPFVEQFTADGERFVSDAIHISGTKNWNPGWFGHPGSTVIYPLAITFGLANRLDRFWGSSNLFVLDQFAQNPSPFYFIGRVFSTFCAIISISVIYRVGRQFGNRGVGLIAASLIAVSPLHVFISRLARTDSPATMFVLLSIWGATEILESASSKYYLLAGIAAGMAMSTKYYGLLSIVALPIAHLVKHSSIELSHGKNRLVLNPGKVHWRKLLLGLGCVPFTFILTSPFAVLNWHTTLNDLTREGRNLHLGADGFSPLENFWWYISRALPDALGWSAVFFILIGLGWAICKRHRLAAVTLPFASCFMLLISYQGLHWDRWISPILAIFALFAALGQSTAISYLTRFFKQAWGRPLLYVVLVSMIMIQPMTTMIAESINRSLTDTRLLAREWIQSHLSWGTHIVLEAYTAPLDADKFVLTRAFSASQQSVAEYCRAGVDYLVLSSEIQKRYEAEPVRYQANINFYKQLQNHADLIYQAAPIRGQITGPTITVYSLTLPLTAY